MEGIIDLLHQFDEENIIPVDHKSSSRYGSMKGKYMNQFKTYLWSGSYKRLCVNQIYLQQTANKGRFAHEYISFDPTVMADWQTDVVEDLKTMLHFMEHDYYPRREKSCFDFNQTCGYLPLCNTKLKMLEFTAGRDYQAIAERESPVEPKIYKKRHKEDMEWIRTHA